MPYHICTISGKQREQRCNRKDTKNGLPEYTAKNAGVVFNRENKRAEPEYTARSAKSVGAVFNRTNQHPRRERLGIKPSARINRAAPR